MRIDINSSFDCRSWTYRRHFDTRPRDRPYIRMFRSDPIRKDDRMPLRGDAHRVRLAPNGIGVERLIERLRAAGFHDVECFRNAILTQKEIDIFLCELSDERTIRKPQLFRFNRSTNSRERAHRAAELFGGLRRFLG